MNLYPTTHLKVALSKTELHKHQPSNHLHRRFSININTIILLLQILLVWQWQN